MWLCRACLLPSCSERCTSLAPCLVPSFRRWRICCSSVQSHGDHRNAGKKRVIVTVLVHVQYFRAHPRVVLIHRIFLAPILYGNSGTDCNSFLATGSEPFTDAACSSRLLSPSVELRPKGFCFVARTFIRLQEQAAVPDDMLTAYYPAASASGAHAKRQAAGACRGCELERALEWRNVVRSGLRWGCSGAGQARPGAVIATAYCTATLSMPHPRRVQPALAAARKAGGARCARTRSIAQRASGCGIPVPPTSERRTTSCCGPPWLSSG